MAAIGRIRKHGVILMIIIGVALLAFIVGDLTNIINFGRNTIVQVDGNKVRATANGENQYAKYYAENVALHTLLQKISDNDFDPNAPAFQEEMHRLTWEQIKHETFLDEELENIGLAFSDKMKEDAVVQLLGSEFTKALNGATQSPACSHLATWFRYLQIYNPGINVAQFAEFCKNPENKNQGETYNIYSAIQREYLLELKENTYFGLAYNSIRYSGNLLKQMEKDNAARTGKMLAININDPAFNDLTYEISDKEAKKYFKEHKNRYMVRETQKDLNMIIFNATPSKADTAAAEQMANEQFNLLQSSASIKDFTAQNVKLDKTKLMYRQSDGVFEYNGHKAYYTQLDTTVWLKDNESYLQYQKKLNRQKLMGLYNQYLPQNEWSLNSQLHPADSVTLPSYIRPTQVGDFYYFGRVNAVEARPDSIQMSCIFIDYKTDDNKSAKLTEEEAYQKALEIQAALHGTTDTAALDAYKDQYGYKLERGSDKRSVIEQWIVDGTFYGDTTSYFLYSQLMNATDSNRICIQKAEGGYVVALKWKETNRIKKSQYVLYPVPLMPSTKTAKDIERKANNLASSVDASGLNQKVATKNGGQFIPVTVTNMQYIYGNQQYHVDIREVVNWAFSESDDAGNENGSVASNAFKGTIYSYAQGMDENYQQDRSYHLMNVGEVYIVAGITATTEMRKPKFKQMKERVKADMIAEKKMEAATARVKKAFKGDNMDALALTYNTNGVTDMNISFSDYNNNMESAAIGKLSTLAKGKKTVISGTNFIYVVSVENVISATDVANERVNQAKVYAMQQGADEATATNYASTANKQYMKMAAEQTVLGRTANVSEYSVNIAKRIFYNDIEDNVKIVDHRHRFYGNGEN